MDARDGCEEQSNLNIDPVSKSFFSFLVYDISFRYKKKGRGYQRIEESTLLQFASHHNFRDVYASELQSQINMQNANSFHYFS